MEITGAQIDWMDGYANAPRLVVEVDGKVPARSDLRYTEHRITAQSSGLSREQEAVTGTREREMDILFATDYESGYVSFVMVGSETSHPGASGGDFTLEDGSVVHVRSGWTISSAAIREIADVVECTFREGGMRGGLAGFLQAWKAAEVLDEFLPGVEMFDDGSGLTFRWEGGPTKAEWQAAEHERWAALRCPQCGSVLRAECPQGEWSGRHRTACPGFYDGRRPYSRWPEFVGVKR